jgi:hypothetical protein
MSKIHGWNSIREARNAITSWSSDQGFDDVDYSTVELLAIIAGQTREQFTQSHTVLPFRRFLTESRDEFHGSASQRSLLTCLGMAEIRSHACFCDHCVAEDIEFHGTSYWRRGHQLPGIYWCSKHGKPLSFTTVRNPFASAPGDYLQTSQSFDPAWVTSIKSNDVIKRYVAIAHELLEVRKPIKNKVFLYEISKRCRDIGLTFENGIQSSDLRTYINGKVERQWQEELRYRKTPLVKVRSRRNNGFETSSVVLVMAALFESSDQALNRLLYSNPIKEGKIGVPEATLRSMYQLTHGNHVTMANTLGVNRYQVMRWLKPLGLPPVGTNDHAKMLLVLKQLVCGEGSLSKACEEHGLQLPYMRSRLEVALQPLMDMLAMFSATPVEKEGRWPEDQRSNERIQSIKSTLKGIDHPNQTSVEASS